MDPSKRADEFSKSQRFLDLVNDAKAKGVIVEMDGMTTIVKHETGNSESRTEWRWNTPDCEDFIFDILQKRTEIYKTKN